MRPRSCANCGDIRAATHVRFHLLPGLGSVYRHRGRAFDVCERHALRAKEHGEAICRRPSSLSALNEFRAALPGSLALAVVLAVFFFA